MDRLEPVARIRQRARHDHAHRVIEIARFISSVMETGRISEGPPSGGGRSLRRHFPASLEILRKSAVIFIADRASVRHSYRLPVDRFFLFIFKVLLQASSVLRRSPDATQQDGDAGCWHYPLCGDRVERSCSARNAKDASQFRHIGAGDAVRRGRSDRPRAGFSGGHSGPAAPGPPQRRVARQHHRGSDPDRHRADRRLAAPHAWRYRCRRSASPAACCCSRSPRKWCSACACAARAKRPNRRSRSSTQYRRFPARHPADGRSRRHHRDRTAVRPRRRQTCC